MDFELSDCSGSKSDPKPRQVHVYLCPNTRRTDCHIPCWKCAAHLFSIKEVLDHSISNAYVPLIKGFKLAQFFLYVINFYESFTMHTKYALSNHRSHHGSSTALCALAQCHMLRALLTGRTCCLVAAQIHLSLPASTGIPTTGLCDTDGHCLVRSSVFPRLLTPAIVHSVCQATTRRPATHTGLFVRLPPSAWDMSAV